MTRPPQRVLTLFLAGAVLAWAGALPAPAQVVARGDAAFAGGSVSGVSSPTAVFAGPDEAVLLWEARVDGLVWQRTDAQGFATGPRAGLVANDFPDGGPYGGPITLRREPAATVMEESRVVSAWVEEHQRVRIDDVYQETEPISSRVVVRRFDDHARALGRRFAVSGGASRFETSPVMTRLSNGRIALVWESADTGGGTGVQGRLLNGRGVPLGEVFRVDDGAQPGSRPAIAPAEGGGFLVVWQACCDAGGDEGVFARLFAPDGTPDGLGVAINAVTDGNQLWPAVARGADGGFLAAWMSPGRPDSGLTHRIVGRGLDPRGQPYRLQVTLSQGDGSAHGAPTLAAAPGGFLVLWTRWVGAFTAGVHAAAVTPEGARRGDAIKISSGVVGTQWRLALARDTSDGADGFLAAWQSFDQDGVPAIEVRPLAVLAGGSRSADIAPAPR